MMLTRFVRNCSSGTYCLVLGPRLQSLAPKKMSFKVMLLCVHFAAGGRINIREFARMLAREWETIAEELPGRDSCCSHFW
jgi:hypothetical protein